MSQSDINVLAIIPARAGSKRVPDKNIRPFAGTNLTEIAVRQALGSSMVTDIVVSSDSEVALASAKISSRVISLRRPAGISTDESPAIDYVRHALREVETSNRIFEIVVVLQPSSPLRTSADIDETIKLLLQHPEADSAVSVVKIDHMVHPLKMKVMRDKELLPFLEDENGRFAAHELPSVYVRNCAVYATWRRDLETRKDVIGKKSFGYVMPAERSVDINEMIDFRFAEFLKGDQSQLL
jgi:CMP-N,N'-diacetyllegionaminic acid synthase